MAKKYFEIVAGLTKLNPIATDTDPALKACAVLAESWAGGR